VKILEYLNERKKKKRNEGRTTCSSTISQTIEASHSFFMAFGIEKE
jgi:hypothetical protein